MPYSRHFRQGAFLAGLAGIVLLTSLIATMRYRNTQQLIDSRNWVQHTLQVLTTLQSAEDAVHQSAANALLSRATGAAVYGEMQNAQRARFLLLGTQLVSLVSDNPQEEAVAEELIPDFTAEAIPLTGAPIAKKNQAVGNAVLVQPLTLLEVYPRVSGHLGMMRLAEEALLHQRLEVASRRAQQSVRTIALFLVITAGISVALFLLLWLDELKRRRLQIELDETNHRLQETVVAMRESAERSAIAAAASEELQICIEPQESYNVATRFLEQMAPHSSGALALINNSRQMVETVSTWGDTNLFPEAFSLDACCALRSGRQRWHSSASPEIECGHHLAVKAPEYSFCLPLAAHGETLGAVLIQFAAVEDFTHAKAHRKELEEFGEMVSMAVANLNLRRKLKNQSIRDGLTGLFNRHFLEVAFERELHRANRHNTPISVFMLDVDHFKNLNDTFGHEIGDAVLRELAVVMQNTVRAEDIICRYGGEEFAIILPDLSQEVAFDRAEVLRKAVEQMRVRCGQSPAHQITVSIGTATYPRDGSSQEKLLRTADDNLYRAKRKGRNCTVSEDVAVI